MKKYNFLILSVAMLLFLNGCAGYTPIFGSNKIPFKISEHSIEGDRIIGNKIYSKLHNLSQTNDSENNIYSNYGIYTSCELDHPHYYFASKQMKMVPDKHIIAKPIVLHIRELPIFALPALPSLPKAWARDGN